MRYRFTVIEPPMFLVRGDPDDPGEPGHTILVAELDRGRVYVALYEWIDRAWQHTPSLRPADFDFEELSHLMRAIERG